MTELFGIPVDTLLVVLLVALAVALGVVGAPGGEAPGAAEARRPERRAPPRVRQMAPISSRRADVRQRRSWPPPGRLEPLLAHTIRGTAVATRGQTDELVSAKGTEVSLGTGLGSSTRGQVFRRIRGRPDRAGARRNEPRRLRGPPRSSSRSWSRRPTGGGRTCA